MVDERAVVVGTGRGNSTTSEGGPKLASPPAGTLPIA
jgi:hypothetical protein